MQAREYATAAEMLESYARIKREAFAPRDEPVSHSNRRVVLVHRQPNKVINLPAAVAREPVKLVKTVPDHLVQRPHDFIDVGYGRPAEKNARGAIMAQNRARWKPILMEICVKHGVTVEQILGDARSVPIVKARHEACYRMSLETPLSFVEIGKRLGGRDHTTIAHGIRKHKERMEAGTI